MKTRLKLLAIFHLLSAICLSALAQGTAFTYQGRLNVAGSPANGLYDFRFRLAVDNQGITYAGNAFLTNAIPVTNGLFTTAIDFGAGLLTGTSYWLAVEVRTNNPGNTLGYTELVPLQALTPTPYAIFATTASNVSGTVSAAQISGTVSSSTLPPSPGFTGTVTANNFVGNGAGLTNLNAASLKGSGSVSNLTLAGDLYLPTSSGQPVGLGIIYAGSSPLIFVGPYGGSGDFFAGPGAGNLTLSGNANLGVGWMALNGITSGADNSACGPQALEANTSGSENTANGWAALRVNTTGGYNTANGAEALYSNSTGFYNTANGAEALQDNSTGGYNTADGAFSLYKATGSTNTALGYYAGYNLAAGSFNIDIGNLGLATDTNIIRIGSGQAQAFIAGVITGNGGGLTNLNAAQLTGTLPLSALPAALVTNNATGINLTGTFTGNGAGLTGVNASTLGGSALTFPFSANNGQSGLGAGTNFYLNDKTLYLRWDQSHGLAYNGNGITNFPNSAVQPDGPVLWGFGGGALGVLNGGAQAMLTWNSSGVSVNGSLTLLTPTVYDGSDVLLHADNHYNFSVGPGAGNLTMSGSLNTASGNAAFSANTTGSDNTASGAYALNNNTSGGGNVADGVNALSYNQTGNNNTAIGHLALANSTNDSDLVAIGFQALRNDNAANPTDPLTGFGEITLTGNGENTAIGCDVLGANTTGYDNTASGAYALGDNVTGYENTANGAWALAFAQAGYGNTAMGQATLMNLNSGNDNIAVGDWAGNNLHTGDNNIYIGNSGNSTESGIIRIGTQGTQTATYLAGTVYANGVALTSDRSTKENFARINPQEMLAKVAALPVTKWNYKSDSKAEQHIGPMAQDFQAAFGLNGGDDKHISVVDEGGVALAAIQGLNQKLNEKDAEIEALRQSVAELKQMVQTIVEKK
jgi:hypothetical protein